jgi:hypothetical protein
MRNCEDGKRGFDQRAEYRPNDALYVDEDPCLICVQTLHQAFLGAQARKEKVKISLKNALQCS